ncbi:MAG: hypothetical protein KatS3mg068_1543 [Candidatus Sericytochromatia bacterium]|nr:MAG: hypothetical protein KatS3mg068_1543 [Candidatus Sericytochromatia bacterium]
MPVKKKFNYKVLDVDEFIKALNGYPYQEVLVKSLELKELVYLMFENPEKFNILKKLENFSDLEKLEENSNIKEYLLTIIDYDLVEILKELSERYKILFYDFYLPGLVNFLLKEFIENILENDERFVVVKNKYFKKLNKKNYPVFIQKNKSTIGDKNGKYNEK